MRLEPAGPWSRVKHSTTELPHYIKMLKFCASNWQLPRFKHTHIANNLVFVLSELTKKINSLNHISLKNKQKQPFFLILNFCEHLNLKDSAVIIKTLKVLGLSLNHKWVKPVFEMTV